MTSTERCLSEDDALACAEGAGTEERRRAWEAHLDACGACRQLVSLLAARASGGAPDELDPAAEPPRFFPHQQIGRFELRSPLGAGGMGVVFEAFDPALDRRVAVKLVRLGATRDRADAEDRLVRESRALARLNHPNVVTLYEAGRHGDEIFLAMELVDGTTVADWLTARPSWRAVVDAFVQVGRGLAAAHAVGLIHRDVKPENMLRGTDGRVRIGDFGVVRHERDGDVPDASPDGSPDGSPDPSIHRGPAPAPPAMPSGPLPPDSLRSSTRPGTVLGTPRYMAPELRAGAPASRQSDQWSFAASLWVALGGQLGRGLARSTAPRAPRWLRQVIERGLARDPDARWPSIDAMLRRLDVRRRRAIWLGAGALAIVAVAVFAGTRLAPHDVDPCAGVAGALAGIWDPARAVTLTRALLATGEPSAPAVAIAARHGLDARAQRWLALRGEVCRATAMRPPWGIEPGVQTECLDRQRATLRATVDGVVVLERANPRGVLDAVQDLPRADECASAERLVRSERLPADPARRQRLAASADQLDHAVAAWRLSADPSALATATQVSRDAGDHAPLRARALQLVAMIQRTRLDPAVIDTAHAAIAAAIEAGDDIVQTQVELALVNAAVMVVPQPARDVDWLLHEAEARVAALTRFAPETARRLRYDLLLTRATVAHTRDRIDDANIDARAALDLGAPLFGADSWHLARARSVLVAGLLRKDRYREALAELEPTVPLIERYLGPDHPELASQLHFQAAALYFLGDTTRALAVEQRALAIAQRKAPVGLQMTFLELIGDIRMAAGELADGIRALEADLALVGKAPSTAGDPRRLRTRIGCARQAIAARALPPSLAQRRALLAAATCFLGDLRPHQAVPLIEPVVGPAPDAPDALDVQLRFALARALRDRNRDGDDARSRAEADQARRDCDRLPGGAAALARAIDAWRAAPVRT